MLPVALYWFQRVDSDIQKLLERLSPCGLDCLVAYSPETWIGLKWSVITLATLVSTFPILSFLLDRFASPGLLPSEIRSWRTSLIFVGITVPFGSWLLIWRVLPWLFAKGATDIERFGLIAAYDVLGLYSLAVTIIFFLFIIFSWSFGMMSIGLFGALRLNSIDSWRLRGGVIAGVSIVFFGYTSFSFDLLLFFWALGFGLSEIFFKIGSAISFGYPSNSPNFDLPNRDVVVDCRCAGGCPSFSDTATVPQDWGEISVEAICLNKDEQKRLVDLSHRWGVTSLVIPGCDLSPIPRNVVGSLGSLNIRLSGLGWMDVAESDVVATMNERERIWNEFLKSQLDSSD